MTETTIDRPISGDISRRNRTEKEQLGVQEFLAALDALLDMPGVESIRWEQYTPYFNDGEPCEFGVREACVKFAGTDDSDLGDEGDGYIEAWSFSDWQTKKTVEIPGLTEAQVLETKAALEAFDMDAFENVVEDNFGDHAQVTATKAGFDVEFYEHD